MTFPILRLAAALLLAAELSACSYVGVPEITPTAPFMRAPQRKGTVEKLDTAKALAMLNAYRARSGVAPLVIDPGLLPIAQAQADLMAKYDSLDAARSEHLALRRRVNDAGYGARVAGENIAVGQLSWAEVFQAWQDSPGHNRNMLDPDFTHVAIAAAYRDDARFRVYWAIVFSKPR